MRFPCEAGVPLRSRGGSHNASPARDSALWIARGTPAWMAGRYVFARAPRRSRLTPPPPRATDAPASASPQRPRTSSGRISEPSLWSMDEATECLTQAGFGSISGGGGIRTLDGRENAHNGFRDRACACESSLYKPIPLALTRLRDHARDSPRRAPADGRPTADLTTRRSWGSRGTPFSCFSAIVSRTRHQGKERERHRARARDDAGDPARGQRGRFGGACGVHGGSFRSVYFAQAAAASARYACAAAGSGPLASSGRAPGRRRLPQTSAPMAKMAAAHQNAVVYPSTAACCSTSGPGTRPDR